MYKKFKDLKQGDRIYITGINDKTYRPFFCEYELVSDMEILKIDGKFPVYQCFMIPSNGYDPKNCFYKWDGVNPIEYRPGWKYNNDGKGCQDSTHIDLAKEYYQNMMEKCYMQRLKDDIAKLKKKLDELEDLKKYHILQMNNFVFNRKI